MKQGINPAVGITIIVVVVAVAIFFGYKATGAGDKVTKPQSMSQFMGGADKAHAPSNAPGSKK